MFARLQRGGCSREVMIREIETIFVGRDRVRNAGESKIVCDVGPPSRPPQYASHEPRRMFGNPAKHLLQTFIIMMQMFIHPAREDATQTQRGT